MLQRTAKLERHIIIISPLPCSPNSLLQIKASPQLLLMSPSEALLLRLGLLHLADAYSQPTYTQLFRGTLVFELFSSFHSLLFTLPLPKSNSPSLNPLIIPRISTVYTWASWSSFVPQRYAVLNSVRTSLLHCRSQIQVDSCAVGCRLEPVFANVSKLVFSFSHWVA